MTPLQIAELTFCEALLYSLGAKPSEIPVEAAEAKSKLLHSLSIDDKIALAMLKSGHK